jgi:hypothetical protein
MLGGNTKEGNSWPELSRNDTAAQVEYGGGYSSIGIAI